MNRKKTLDDLTLMDDYMFAAVMENTEFLRPFLEFILKVKIAEIKLIEPKRTEKEGYYSKGIRLDLYVIDETGTIYNVEVQTYTEDVLPKRMRFYQSVVDISILSPGNQYSQLRKSYIIFICNYDPFERGRYIYTFENMCNEEPDLRFGDDTYKIVVNTKGTRGEISAELKEILTYMESETVTGKFSQKLDDAVNAVKSSEERRLEYMRLTLRDNEMIAKGREEGREEGAILSMLKMIAKGFLTVSQAAELSGMSVEEFEKKAAALA